MSLDVGSSSVRALLFDRAGQRVQALEAQTTYQATTSPDGRVDVDPDELFDLTTGCLDSLLKDSAGAPISAVAADTFWHSLMGTDASGRPTTRLISWADTRPAAAARQLRRRLPEQEVHARTGCRLHASYWPAKLTWLAGAEPDAYQATRHWMSFGEYFLWRLSGQALCSLSMASATGLFDQHKREWDQPLLAELAIEPQYLSPLVDLDHQVSVRRWPALRSAPWLPAVGDGACSNVGSGCVDGRRVAVNVGTSGAMRLLWEAGDVDIPFPLWCYHADRRRFVMGGALSEGGNLWAWLQHVLRLPSSETEEALLADMEPDGHGLTVLPFIAGERSPGWLADARATFSGMSLSTRPLDLVRACLESIAYRFAIIFQQMRPLLEPSVEVVASGSAILRSPAWLQILADVLNRPVLASAQLEATSRGTALLALEALGLLPNLATAQVASGQVYQPDAGRHGRYQAAMDRQRQLYAAITSQPNHPKEVQA
ncbi:MAG: gluconokinase [Chloroflexota bacterium]